jgi:hypothetical protein
MIVTFVFIGGATGSTLLAQAFEPVTMILLGFGLLGLARFRRKAKTTVDC